MAAIGLLDPGRRHAHEALATTAVSSRRGTGVHLWDAHHTRVRTTMQTERRREADRARRQRRLEAETPEQREARLAHDREQQRRSKEEERRGKAPLPAKLARLGGEKKRQGGGYGIFGRSATRPEPDPTLGREVQCVVVG